MHKRSFGWLLFTTILITLLLGGISVRVEGAARTPRATRQTGGSTGGSDGSVGAKLTATAGHGSGDLNATATSISATLTAIKQKALPQEEAQAAIESFALQVLGITVQVKAAGGLSGNVTRNLDQTAESSQAQQEVLSLAVKSYGAILANGAASLSYGTGTISGDVNLDVQASSLGVYTVYVSSGSLSAEAALALAQQTFPGVAEHSYYDYDSETGFAWYAYGSTTAIDPATRKAITTAEAVILYVLPGKNGKTSVTATVGRGDFASAITPR
ncbi:MAG: hypothetical protein KF726_21815 [Anaerolineae bacterium]|nr:hypothetical protein [Anaerolineae bacterium]